MQLIADADPCPLALQTFSWAEGYKGSHSSVGHERRTVPASPHGSRLQPTGRRDLVVLSRTVGFAEALESMFIPVSGGFGSM